MKTKMKALTLALCAVMLVATTVFVTVAYLTSTTATVTNTFTVGNVAITLDEAKVNVDGDPIDNNNEVVALANAPRVITNSYKLMPGHTYTKDPTVHIDANSEPCYVFVQVVNNISAAESTATDYISIAEQMENNGWKAVSGVDNLYIYASGSETKTILTAGENRLVFGSFTIDSSLTNLSSYVTANNPDKIITVQAYAIQADGFENMDPAQIWATAPSNWVADTASSN